MSGFGFPVAVQEMVVGYAFSTALTDVDGSLNAGYPLGTFPASRTDNRAESVSDMPPLLAMHVTTELLS